MKIGILSDDLTGAGDVGLAFLKSGWPVEIEAFSDSLKAPSRGAFVINTEARASRNPRGSMEEGALRLLKAGCDFFYLKLDSCLRGDIAAMLDGFIHGLGLKRLIFAPAFPEMGRTTENGVQLLNGIPVHKSPMRDDPENPIRESHIPIILKGCEHFGRIVVENAKQKSDMTRIARMILKYQMKAAAGSAGLAYGLAHVLESRKQKAENGKRNCRKTLVVFGSKNPVSISQLNFLEKSGRNGFRILKAYQNHRFNLSLRHSRDFERLVLVGGRTAFESCKALGISRMRIFKEPAAGCALCEVTGKPYEIVLKPGGFGDEDALVRCLQ